MALDDDARAGGLDPLPVQCVGHHLGRAEQAVEHAPLLQGHGMTQGEFFLQRAIGGHPVVHPPRQVANLGMQRTTHRDVHFLKATTDAKKRLPAFDTGPHQRQGDRVAGAVEGSMRLGLGLAILFGMHVGTPAC